MSNSKGKSLIILDRDGVLNEMVVNPEHGLIDSPLHPDQVTVFPWVPQALRTLSEMGYLLAIATNQPAWAKKKTTKENLDAVHAKIVSECTVAGATFTGSHICFHRSEDKCSCRKPRTGLLEAALEESGPVDLENSWMVGDGVTDVEAGQALGLKTAFLGPDKCYNCKILADRSLEPNFTGPDLRVFAESIRT